MKIIIPRRTRQRGATLIEVMLAGLVLTVGGVSYMRLQQIGLQSSFNDYARTQSTSIAQGFVDSLRGNIKYLALSSTDSTGNIIGGKEPAVALPQGNANCASSTPGSACALATLKYHRYLTSLRMGNALAAGQSLLCYRQSTDRSGYIRVAMLWRDNTSSDKAALKASDCPADFNTALSSVTNKAASTSDNHTNSITIYAQL